MGVESPVSVWFAESRSRTCTSYFALGFVGVQKKSGLGDQSCLIVQLPSNTIHWYAGETAPIDQAVKRIVVPSDWGAGALGVIPVSLKNPPAI